MQTKSNVRKENLDVEKAMQELQELIDKNTTWKDVDADEFMRIVRGRE